MTETTATGTAVEIALDCTDPEGDPLEHEITGEPDHGSLGAVSGGKVTYTPDAGPRRRRLLRLPRHGR